MRAITLAAAMLSLACAATTGGTAPTKHASRAPATVEVEVLRGFRVPERPLREVPRSVALVVDVRPEALAAEARGRADTLVRQLPEAIDVALVGLGAAAGDECAVGRPIEAGAPRSGMRAAVASLRSRGRGSLAATLTELANAEQQRVIVVTSLPGDGGSCGDLCAATSALAARGQWVDWILLGDAPAPACLAAIRPDAREPGPFASEMSAGDARVEVRSGRDPEGPLLTEGPSSAPLRVEGGLVTLRVDLDPPEVVGPLQLSPGERVVVRLLDFPMADRPLRQWRAERR